MVRRLAVSAFFAAAFALLPPAHAIELGLAGIELNQSALDLLASDTYGPPDYFGPSGAVTTWGIQAATPGPAGPRAAPRLGIGGYGPAAAAPAPAARPPGGLGVSFGRTAGAAPAARAPAARSGGGFGINLGGRTAPARVAPAPATSLPAMRFSFSRRTAPAAGTPVTSARSLTAAPPGQGGGMVYWLYNKGGGAQVVVGIAPTGQVNSIIVSGLSYPAVKTEGGVRLGDSYTSVLDKYGFPDATQNVGGALVLRYASAGLTLTLRDMRVQTIALATSGAEGPARGRAAVPMAAPRLGMGRTGAARPSTSGARTSAPRMRFRFGRRD